MADLHHAAGAATRAALDGVAGGFAEVRARLTPLLGERNPNSSARAPPRKTRHVFARSFATRAIH